MSNNQEKTKMFPVNFHKVIVPLNEIKSIEEYDETRVKINVSTSFFIVWMTLPEAFKIWREAYKNCEY